MATELLTSRDMARLYCDACSGCAARDKCRDSRKMTKLTGELLQKPLITIEELPVRC